MIKIAFIEPLIPHYREPFFKGLKKYFDIDLFTYKESLKIDSSKMLKAELKTTYLKTLDFNNKIRIYNIFPLLNNKYDLIIASAEVRSLSLWLLLLFCKFKKTKIILWGHGISVANYDKERKKMPKYKIFFHSLANQLWLYTENEKYIWEKYIESEKIIYLNNTIDITEVNNRITNTEKIKLKNKYGIKQKKILIFSARFNTKLRRADILLKIIKNLDSDIYGFIIIGDGEFKPSFKEFNNVYDFGTLYDRSIKNDLFNISDIYLQPAWLGLSVVEAFSYGLPVFTFNRNKEYKQGVEYGYINNKNGYIAKDLKSMINKINSLEEKDIKEYNKNILLYTKKYLSMDNMILTAKKSINELI